MFLDQAKDRFRPLAEPFDKARAVGFAQLPTQLSWRHPERGVDQANIPARPAITDMSGLDHMSGKASFTAMQRGRKAGEATPDDRHVDLLGLPE